VAANPQILSGPEAVKAARVLERHKKAQQQWPFPWFAPPPNSRHVFAPGAIAAPANATETEIVSYQVQNNFAFALSDILLDASVGTWVPGSVDGSGNPLVSFSVTVNLPVGGSAAQGVAFKDFGQVVTPLGSFANGPWPVHPGELSILHSRDILRATVTTQAPIPSGAPNFIYAIFVGWTWPEN
jgi:hypothetical protein